MTILTVLLVDDEEPVLRAWVRALEREGHDLHTAASVEEAVKLMTRLATIHVALLDLILPGDCSGEDLYHLLRRLHPSAGAAVVSAHFDGEKRQRFEERKIRIEDKPLSMIEQLVMSLWQEPGPRAHPRSRAGVTAFAGTLGLTPSQMDVYMLLVAGYAPKEIARLLHKSHSTILKHVKHIREQTDAHSTQELLAAVIRILFDN